MSEKGWLKYVSQFSFLKRKVSGSLVWVSKLSLLKREQESRLSHRVSAMKNVFCYINKIRKARVMEWCQLKFPSLFFLFFPETLFFSYPNCYATVSFSTPCAFEKGKLCHPFESVTHFVFEKGSRAGLFHSYGYISDHFETIDIWPFGIKNRTFNQNPNRELRLINAVIKENWIS